MECNTLRFGKIKIKGAELGESSCLPDIKNDDYIHAAVNVSEKVSAEDKANLGKGMISTLLPYQVQNGYNRERKELEFDGAILENEYLKAVFVPELGGRLWSLYDKKKKKDLLYANDVFQPCNLALRNAWFSGGVEWNMGIKGHNPLTCSRLFTEECEDKSGNPMLRMYEFERIREAVYSITAKLEEDVLLVNVTLENTSDEDKYMYWWSNIAVDETPDTRVIVPAEETFYCSYTEGGYFLDVSALPYMDGVDVTYATNLTRSRDFFYKIPEDEQKWIAAVDKDGYGLVHMSTKELKGRKLFAWGQGAGGKHWNRWLSDSQKSYIEIQAGLLKTQLEHFVMKANSIISWTEGYSPVNANSILVHGKDFHAATDEIKNRIYYKQKIVRSADLTVGEKAVLRYNGSGWGALENMFREKPVSNIVCFPKESIQDDEAEWLELLQSGKMITPDTRSRIKSYVKGKKWLELTEKATDSWYKYYQMGVILYTEGKTDEAYSAFEKSIECSPNCWAYRNLAQIEKNEYGNAMKAVLYMENAVREKNDYQPLWVNYAEALFANNGYEKWIELYENEIPEDLMKNGRLKMLYALALSKTDLYMKALEVLTDNFVMPDIKEGEFSISHIWLEIHRKMLSEKGINGLNDSEIYEKYPLPYELDYRMH